MPALFLINGPNLNLLGEREPEIYGTTTLADCVALAESATLERGWSFSSAQFNSEGEMIEAIHSARTAADAIVINPGAFTHYSFAIADALAAFSGTIIELHLSNVHAREEWRRISVISPVATGIVAGLGSVGYAIAAEAAIAVHTERPSR
ncbi:MAG: type II 3-dehydroquinate dehydratase [Acidimicrobiia bacterium]